MISVEQSTKEKIKIKKSVGKNILYNGDCLLESDKIKSGTVDLILTDLPYGTVDGIGNNDNIQHGMKGKLNGIAL